MINLTKEILIVQTGDDLARSIKAAINKAKACVCKQLFDTNHVPPSKVTSSPRNKYYAASIMRLFDDHLNAANAPVYDEKWIKNAHTCSKKTPTSEIAKEIVPKTAHDWLNKSSLERLSKDCVLILHFLWQEEAILLPANMKKPMVGNAKANSNYYEIAAAYYTEVLALVRMPFLNHVSYPDMPDITTVMNPSAVSNFEWNAWRMVRCTNWHRIEDINPDDISELVTHLTKARTNTIDWFKYPIAPAAFWGYIQRLYPDRCMKSDTENPIKNIQHASRKVLLSGEFVYPEEYKEIVETWLKYQDRFIELRKSRGLKSYKSYIRSLAILNTYLFGELPKSSNSPPPLPKEFNRKHIDGDNTRSFIAFLNHERSKTTVKGILYHIDSFLNFLAANSNTNNELTGFINPILDIDYPFIKKSSSSNKPAFRSEHFPHLLQFCYAIESFTTHLSDMVFNERLNLYDPQFRAEINTKTWNGAHKIIQTEKYGYVPLVFYRNPLFDPTLPKSKSNKPMSYEPLLLLPRFLFPLVEYNGDFISYPQTNYIRHNIVALETGIRSIHIRWLEKKTYDMHINRSAPLPPLCKLHVNTDKANGAWDATVSKNVIDVLDRQKNLIATVGDPAMEEEVWYDDHEDSIFGKIVTLFPKGGTAGVLSGSSYSKYFRRLIFSFDIFCRFQLRIDPTNPMPEALDELESIDSPYDYLQAINLEAEASKMIVHTPHSCRVSVISEFIRILPPHIIGTFITGHATEAHVMYYAKVDPAYLKTLANYQKNSVEEGWLFERQAMSTIKAEDINSKLQQAFRRDKDKSLIDFGAISFDRETKDNVHSGMKVARQSPIDSLAFMPTHICVFCNICPQDIIDDLGAIPGVSTPCGGCYYSIKTVDHLPRIHGLIRVYTDECSELESYISEAKRNGASPESLLDKANRRKFLASEIISWSITAHCLEQMFKEIKTRSSFLVEKPEIVSEHLERIELEDHSLANLIARTAEAKSHAEYFTPQLKQQILHARKKLLAFTGKFNQILQEAPTGFTLIDEFRGLIRSACEVLGISLHDLSSAMKKPMSLEHPDVILKLISSTKDNS